MSSLKDWYRYVDSRARTRPGSDAPPERERSGDEPRDREDPVREPGAADPDARAAGAPEPDAAGAGEEGLDVWSGLFSPPRKPEPKPTTAPLKRPAARLDEVPPDLIFIRKPADSPPAPQFPRPDVELSIPSFDEFVSPYVPESSPPAVAPTAFSGVPAAGPSAPRPESVLNAAPERSAAPPAAEAAAQAAHRSIDAAPAPAIDSPAPSVPEPEPAAPAGGELASAESAPPATEPGARSASPPAPPPGGPEAGASDDTPVSTADASAPDAAAVAADQEGQVPWRSPFPPPGPGRTVSSGAPSPRPEPIVARQILSQGVEETGEGAGAALSRPPSRPAPGTEAWERERVDRLARTFRETLRALEQSLAGPATPAAPGESEKERERPEPRAAAPPPAHEPGALAAPRDADLAPSAAIQPAPLAGEAAAAVVSPPEPADLTALAAAPTPVEEPPAESAALPDLDLATRRDVLMGLPPVLTTEAPAAAIPESTPETVAAAPEEIALSREAAAQPLAPSPVQDLPIVPSPPLPAAAPDVLRNIEEAALIRQRLPQHIDMLLRIPTNEVAQNSYKSPFRETREELIRRLLDPQLTLEEAARVLGVCPTTVRRYTNRGMLHCHRTPGNQRRFRMSDVLQFVEQFGDRIDRAAEAPQFEEAA